MSYKIGSFKRVIRLLDSTILPCTYDAGVIVALDEFSPFVREFKAWVALGNVPAPADPDPIPDPRLVLDEAERTAVSGEQETKDWLNKTPAQAAQWVDDTHAARLAAGDTQVQAALFILRKIVRLLLIVARGRLR